jgi:hypothetical protein
MKLTKEDCDNLLDALEEWNNVVGCIVNGSGPTKVTNRE